jgi:hypothetical protein
MSESAAAWLTQKTQDEDVQLLTVQSLTPTVRTLGGLNTVRSVKYLGNLAPNCRIRKPVIVGGQNCETKYASRQDPLAFARTVIWRLRPFTMM